MTDNLVRYELTIAKDKTGRAYVKEERLRRRRPGIKRGWPLILQQSFNNCIHMYKTVFVELGKFLQTLFIRVEYQS